MFKFITDWYKRNFTLDRSTQLDYAINTIVDSLFTSEAQYTPQERSFIVNQIRTRYLNRESMNKRELKRQLEAVDEAIHELEI